MVQEHGLGQLDSPNRARMQTAPVIVEEPPTPEQTAATNHLDKLCVERVDLCGADWA